ncbi:MAG: DNA-3-methyladenine glycosylase [Thermoplasmata archaeon]|nr:DNA-3-methyladenine glycosylase [Thermoplasmata archaeon]
MPSSRDEPADLPGSVDWRRAFDHPREKSWYDRPAVLVARALLGDWLVGPTPGGWRAGRIVETEAYGARDPASHAFRGVTARNRSMFADPGTIYVYRIHQVHCANLTARSGQAVLLRAVEPVTEGLSDARGPGRLCRAFGISLRNDGNSAITGRRYRVAPGPAVRGPIVTGPRVGIRWARSRPWRFALVQNPWVSSPRPSGWSG